MTLRLESSGERLDAALARLVPELSRSQAQRLLAQGLVTANGKPLKKNEKSTAGMVLELTLPEAQETDLPAQEIPLDIRYEDSDVIVINKPKGIVVHPAPGHPDGTVVNALLHHCGDSLSGIGGEKRPGIVHRIDKDTSGLLIAAKNDAAHAHLSAQLKDHTLARTYECIVCGNLKEDSGTIDAPIGRHPTDRKKMAVTEKNSRNAVTHWDAIAACTIGGVSTTGGVGTVPGVLVGVLVFELMKVALQFMNVNSSYTYIVQGLVIIVAVAIDIRKYLAKK